MINPALEARKQRLENIKKMLDKLVPIDYNKALATIMINTGAKRATAIDYLRSVMEFYGFTAIDGTVRKIKQE